MPSKKISQLTAATTPLKTDLHALARGTSNRKLTTEGLFSETITLTNFVASAGTSELIAGRWYRVTECGDTGAEELLVLATSNATYSQHCLWLPAGNQDPIWVQTVGLNQIFNTYRDGAGNQVYRQPYVGGGGFALNNGNIFDTRVVDTPSIYGVSSADNITAGHFGSGNYSLYSATHLESYFHENSSIVNPDEQRYQLNGCVFRASSLTVISSGSVLRNVYAFNSAVTVGENVNLENCHFENVTVEILNQATVKNLTIIGNWQSDVRPYYQIDGNLQARVYDNWGGFVYADKHRGSSTVRAMIEYGTSGDEMTWDGSQIFLAAFSPVGTYLLGNTGESNKIHNIEFIFGMQDNEQHLIRIKASEAYLINANEAHFKFVTRAAAVNTSDIITYHGKTAKVGELATPGCFVDLRAVYNATVSAIQAHLEWGCHYD